VRIGIDFDNTIACYDGVFHKAALEQGLVPADLPDSKNAVRDHLVGCGREDDFTLLQGTVYGARMDLVAPYPGVASFLGRARAAGHRPLIVSHKTRYPIRGPRHDMHAAAQEVLVRHGLVGDGGVRPQDVYFEPTKEAKIARAAGLGCDLFIDDLLDVLQAFPAGMRRILFDPDDRHAATPLGGIERCRNWAEAGLLLLGTPAVVGETPVRHG
jgi:phosphoglycolate phosphatase-like HAD superfamily hydrolase